MDYILHKSKRKTLSVSISDQAQIVVRVSNAATPQQIEAFLAKHQRWIANHLQKQQQFIQNHPEPGQEEIAAYQKEAKQYIPRRVEYYAAMMGLTPTGIKITSAKKRYGSCNAKNSLCFSWRLMQYPPQAIDYVVVHELAHIKHKDHSAKFYALIEQYLPQYRQYRAMLRE